MKEDLASLASEFHGEAELSLLVMKYEEAREKWGKVSFGGPVDEIFREMDTSASALGAALAEQKTMTGVSSFFQGDFIYAVDDFGDLFRWRRDFVGRKKRPGKCLRPGRRKNHDG